MIFGIHHSTLNTPGGAEFVTITMINALKERGHKVFVLTNEKIDQTKVKSIFGKTVEVDKQIILPNIFSPYDWSLGAVYSNALRSLFLRSKCNILIDTCSNSLFPWVDIAYIHYPCVPPILNIRDILYHPYYSLVRRAKKRTQLSQKIVFVNSDYIAKVLMKTLGIRASVLNPPVHMISSSKNSITSSCRTDTVVTVSRIAHQKNLEIIPQIAKFTSRNIRFIIAGGSPSAKVLHSILRSRKELDVVERVDVLTSLTRCELETILLNSKVYLHTMKGEHFGISIVESMSSGCIPVVHDSGGPKGFVPHDLRYKTVEEAAMKIERAISEWSSSYAKKMSDIAKTYDEKVFSEKFLNILYSTYAL